MRHSDGSDPSEGRQEGRPQTGEDQGTASAWQQRRVNR